MSEILEKVLQALIGVAVGTVVLPSATQIQADIMCLRRELLALSKMLYE